MPNYRNAHTVLPSTATFVIAASDSLYPARADYVCDGTDDDVQIQAAINALPAGGGKVVLLDGTFNITTQTNLVSNMVIEGQGHSTKLNQAGDNSVMGINTETRFEIRDIKFESDRTHDNALLNINDSSTGIIYSCQFRDCLNIGVSVYDVTNHGIWSLYVDNCYFYRCGAVGTTTGAFSVNTVDSTNIHIHKCLFEPNYYRDIDMTSTGKISGVWITENWFEGEDIGGTEYPTDTHINIVSTFDYNYIIENNYFYDVTDATCSAMNIDSAFGLYIKDNIFLSSSGNEKDYGVKVASCRGNIDGNYFWYQDVKRQLEVSGCSGMSITNNWLQGADLHGDLWLTSCGHCLVSGNYVLGDNGEMYGIRIENSCDHIIILGNSIEDIVAVGIGINGSGATNIIAKNNTFENCGTPINATLMADGVVKDNVGFINIAEIRDVVANILETLGDTRGLWTFQEISGTTINDYTRNNHDLTPSEDVKDWDTAPTFKGRATYYDFNRTDEELDTPDHVDFEFGNAAGNDDSAFSVICCISPTTALITNGGTLIGKYDEATPAREWIFRVDANGYPEFECYDESVDKYIGREDQTALTAATWTILMATYDGGEASAGINIYKDGVAVDDADHEALAYTGMEQLGANVQIGANIVAGPVAGNFYGGDATWFMVVAKELSADEVWIIDQRLRGLLGI